MSNKAILEINLNEEYKIKIEDGNKFAKSIFKDVYNEALKNVIEIINYAESHVNIKYDELNNIIAFTGERGKGKSSSMISFRNALIDKENKEKHYDFFIKKDEILNKHFATFDIIDPSLFRKDESLFEIILAKMFDNFQSEIKKNNFIISNDDRRIIISHFQKVFDNLQIINSDRRDLYKKDSIEVLSKMAISSNLRESFKELVSIYLKKFEKEKDFLVIAIDDFDLNISGAYDMLEDLRQFLIQSNIIILIACKEEQLKLILLNYFYNEYELLIKYNSSNISELQLINNTERYLEKLIPFNRRLFLPDVQNLQTIRFKIIDNKKIIFNSDGENFNKLIIKLIFENLNLLQTSNILNKNFIFPNTIRETQNFINILLSLNNVQKLRKYILSDIYVLNAKNKVLFNELEEVSDDIFMLTTLRRLRNLSLENNLRIRRTEALKKLSSASIKNHISIGDIYFLLQEYEKTTSLEHYDNLRFLDTFKMYFSLRLMSFNKNLPSLEITKLGFVNRYMSILPKEKNIKSRDFINFNGTLDWNFDFLEEEEIFILSMFALYLGDGNDDYRQNMDKYIFVDGYKKGVLSPFAIWHNISNVDVLSSIIGFNADTEFVKSNKKWFYKSIFIKQLYNPSFTIKIFEFIGEFRIKEVKETLPNSYFDNVCLLFIYGTIYSLDKLESMYNIEGLVLDYLNFPIINQMLKFFNTQDLFYKSVFELNNKYHILENFTDSFIITDQLKEIVDHLYIYSSENTFSKLSEEVKIYLNSLYNEIRRTEKFTSRFLTHRIDKLRDFEGAQEVINYLEEVKGRFNDDDFESFTENKDELMNYLLGFING